MENKTHFPFRPSTYKFLIICEIHFVKYSEYEQDPLRGAETSTNQVHRGFYCVGVTRSLAALRFFSPP